MSAWTPNKNILIFVTNSLGELDFLLPILCHEKTYKSFTLVFTNQSAYQKYLKSYPYDRIVESLKGNVIQYFIDDSKNKYAPLQKIKHWFKFFNLISLADIVQLEQAGGRGVGRMVVLLCLFLRKTIQIHPHAVNIEVGVKTKIRTRFVTSFPILLSDDKLIDVYRAQGFRKFIKVGFPKFYASWKNELAKYDRWKSPEPHALFFTRPVDKIWMPSEQYKALIFESIQTFRKYFPNTRIIFKLHPREDRHYLESMLESMGCGNYEISEENSMLLAVNCILTIGFFTSAIYDAYSYGRPAIDYYVETQDMREYFPGGRSNKLLNLDFADSREDLDRFVSSVANSSYSLPKKVEELFNASREMIH